MLTHKRSHYPVCSSDTHTQKHGFGDFKHLHLRCHPRHAVSAAVDNQPKPHPESHAVHLAYMWQQHLQQNVMWERWQREELWVCVIVSTYTVQKVRIWLIFCDSSHSSPPCTDLKFHPRPQTTDYPTHSHITSFVWSVKCRPRGLSHTVVVSEVPTQRSQPAPDNDTNAFVLSKSPLPFPQTMSNCFSAWNHLHSGCR